MSALDFNGELAFKKEYRSQVSELLEGLEEYNYLSLHVDDCEYNEITGILSFTDYIDNFDYTGICQFYAKLTPFLEAAQIDYRNADNGYMWRDSFTEGQWYTVDAVISYPEDQVTPISTVEQFLDKGADDPGGM